MSFFDKAKEKALEAADMAKEAAEKAAEAAKLAAAGAAQKIDEGGYVDKAAAKIDEKTGGKYADKVDRFATSAKDTVSKLKPGEQAVDVEYSTEFGAEPTETAAEAAEVFETESSYDIADASNVNQDFTEEPPTTL
ncbi:antitoxin [Nocardioides sp. Kera G14]|uniref:antitoxin n=1 Tax=Nocardioides sp. Kera G14 TaxID=2884264 RepID=UPI001D10AB2C|nr:antitoxin [Nocardioides sp. Kera G14]UDY24135.1 antitoxin [Nocardioides sp. Kera G14]